MTLSLLIHAPLSGLKDLLSLMTMITGITQDPSVGQEEIADYLAHNKSSLSHLPVTRKHSRGSSGLNMRAVLTAGPRTSSREMAVGTSKTQNSFKQKVRGFYELNTRDL